MWIKLLCECYSIDEQTHSGGHTFWLLSEICKQIDTAEGQERECLILWYNETKFLNLSILPLDIGEFFFSKFLKFLHRLDNHLPWCFRSYFIILKQHWTIDLPSSCAEEIFETKDMCQGSTRLIRWIPEKPNSDVADVPCLCALITFYSDLVVL